MTAVSDETGRELEPTYLEAAKRLLIGAIVGSCTCNTKSPELVWHMPHCRYVTLTYALENVENALSASPVAQEPAWRYEIQHGPDGETDWAWVYDAENNLVCTAKTYHAAAIVRASSPPATSAGVGADEIARVFVRWKKSKNLHESLAAQNIEKELLALLSRAGDQSNSTHEEQSKQNI